MNKNWKTLKEKIILKDEWISLRSDKYLMPNNNIIEPYYILEYPAWVNVVAITDKNEIVLVRQYRPGLKKTIIELPSGCYEYNDKNPEETAKRELREETGYSGDTLELLSVTSPNPSNHNNLVYSYLLTDAVQNADQKLDKTEDIEIILIPVQEVWNMLINNEFYQSMHVSTLFYAFLKLNYIKAYL